MLALALEVWAFFYADKAKTTPASLLLAKGIATVFDGPPPSLEASADGERLGFRVPPNTGHVAEEYVGSQRYVTTYGASLNDLSDYFEEWAREAGWKLVRKHFDREVAIELEFRRAAKHIGLTDLVTIRISEFLGPIRTISIDLVKKP